MKSHLMKNKQQGIALVMVLVFLLIMTLASTSAMQQNSMQFTMIGNTQEQTQSYTRAENILRLAEQNIEQFRWSANRIAGVAGSEDECIESAVAGFYDIIAPGTVIDLGIAGSTTVVVGWWCENNPTDTTGDGYGQSAECPRADASPCNQIATSGLVPVPTVANGLTQAPNTVYPPGTIGCGTELYSLRTTFTQQNASNAQRVVESKYAIRCLEVGA